MGSLIEAILAVKLYFVYQKTRNRNINLFFKSFVFGGIYFFLSGLPGKLVQDLFWAEVVFILSWIPLYISLFYLTKLTFYIWGLERFIKPLLLIIIILIIVTSILNIIYFSPAEIRTFGQFVFCFERSPSWLLGASGAFVTLLLLMNAILFFRGGLESKDKFISKRSLLLGSGMGSLSLAAFFNYVVVNIFPRLRFLIFFAGLFLFIGVITIYWGIQILRKE